MSGTEPPAADPNEWPEPRLIEHSDGSPLARSKAPATLAPQPKVVAGGVAGAVVVLLVWVASLLGLDVPDYVAMAAVVVIGSGAAYLKRQ